MPLRDHFRPPLDLAHSWEELHGQWPAVIVQHLRQRLPAGYVAAPRLHSGSQVEIDIGALKQDESLSQLAAGDGNGGVATAVWATPRPDIAIETTLPDQDEYEVRVYDAKRGRRLVAAVEIVSPANKDRPEHRNVFLAKCVALLREGVAVSIVDLVTTRHFNLYAELLALVGHADSTMGDGPPSLYAASCRWIRKGERALLEGWAHALTVGRPLPTLPLWLAADLAVPLELERSYEKACNDLWIA